MVNKLVSPLGFSGEDGVLTPDRIKNMTCQQVGEPGCTVQGHLSQWDIMCSIFMNTASVEIAHHHWGEGFLD